MKKLLWSSLCMVCLTGYGVHAQDTKKDKVLEKKKAMGLVEEEGEGPIMLKFEPDYAAEQLKRRQTLLEKRRMIDTMDIPEKKKLRLIKELYRDVNSKRVQKALLAELKYEDQLDK